MTLPLYTALILLAGLAGGKLANKFSLPSVTGYLLVGLLLGPSALNVITTDVYNTFSLVSEFAIGMLTISVGMELHRNIIRKEGKSLAKLSLGNTLFTAVLVTLTTWLLGMPFQYALIIGSISLTVSPAAIIAIIKEKKAHGEMTDSLVSLVAFDNLTCIVLFGLVLSIVQQAADPATFSIAALLGSVLLDIFLGLLLGFLTGTLFSYFVRIDASADKLLVIFIAVILLNIGIASYLGISPILTSIFTGVTITNLTKKPTLINSVFNRIELPVFILFLTLSGAHINLSIVVSVGLVGLGYIAARGFGRWFGIYIASQFTGLSKKVKRNLGLGLFPQAGIAIGLATIAEQTLPNTGGVITGVILTAVIFFEIFGPLIFRKALGNVGETND